MTPSTAAGRALEQRLAYDRDPAHYEPGDFFIDDRRDIIAIEAEARAEPPRIVKLAWDATAEDVARIRRDWEAAAEARAEGLDVEHPDCGDRCACYVRGVDDEAEATRD